MNQKRDFNTKAASWDDDSKKVRMADAVSTTIRREVMLHPGMDVLELGCGTGLVTMRLAPLVRSVTGLDDSDGMLGALTAKADRQAIANIHVLRHDLDAASPLPAPFDLAVSSMTLHHITDVPGLLHRIIAALRPGGQLALADLDPDGGLFHNDNTGVRHPGFDRKALSADLQAAGFSSVRFADVTRVQRERDGRLLEFGVFLAIASRSS